MQKLKERVKELLEINFPIESIKEYPYGYKINVKAIHGQHIYTLRSIADISGMLYTDITIKRSGTGIVILIKVK